MLLANRIRKIREKKGFSQEEIAARLDMSASGYGQIERKAQHSSFNTLAKIATSLNVSLPFLVDLQDQEYIEKNKF